MAAEEKAEKKSRSGLSAFLGMVLSGLLSIFIASTMFMVGVIHNRMQEGEERQAIVRFLAVEVADIYAETSRSAHAVFVGNRHSQVVAPVMAGARTLGQAISLDADPKLVASVRSIHGRYARVQRDTGAAYSFYTKKKKLTQNQIRKVIADCEGMGEEVREVLRVAAAEGVDEKAISRLEETCSKADALVAALVKQKEKLLPDVKISGKSINMGVWSGRTLGGTSRGGSDFRVYNYSDAPVSITGTSFSLKGFKTRAPGRTPHPHEVKPDESVMYNIDHPRWPDGLPRGPFEETLTIETDCPGYERITVPVKGVVENVDIQRSDHLGRLTVKRDYTQTVEVYNCTRRPVTIRSATCTIEGVEVSFPQGNTVKAQDRSQGGCYHVTVGLKFVYDTMAAGPFEGTLTIETDSPGYESVKIPVKGTVVK